MATSANLKRAVKRIKATLNANYEQAQVAPVAGPVGTGKAFIGGQVFDANISGVTQVVNVGRPAAAQYAAKVGGGVSVSSSGGGGSTSTGGGSGAAITSSFVIANPDALLPNARLLAVSAALSLTDAGAGGAITIGMATPPTLSATSTNDATTGSHAITASAAPGAAESLLKSSGAGNLALVSMTTPLVNTASGNLSLRPASGTVALQNSGGTDRASFVVGSNTFDINPLPDSTADMSVRLFRSTSTTGTKALALYAGDNTSTVVHQLSITGVTTFNTQGSAALDFNIRGDTDSNLMYVDASADMVGFGTASPAYKVDVTGTMRATTSLTTPLLTTATNVDLVINPAGTGAVQFPNDQTLRTSDFDSSFPIEGWQINEVAGISGYSALTIGKIQADELAVRVFVADEVRVDRGDEFWTKSYGIVAESFTTPGSIDGTVSIMFEDSPALAGAIFTNNDWVLIRKLDIDTGITLSNIWGQVATYVNNSDGTQNWTFTLRSGPTSESVTKGSLAIDFGASGAALIHLSVIDAAGAPYIKMRKWAGANPYTPSNFTTYVQIGQLGSIGNSYVTPAGYGLYIRSTANEAQFIVADDNGLQIRGADIKLYNGADQTVNLSYTGTDVWIGLTDSDKRLSWNGTTLSVKGAVEITSPSNFSGSGYLQVGSGTKDSTLDGFNMNSSEFVGQLDGVDQVVMGTNGKITAGAGAVWLDAVGLNVAVVGVGTPTYIRFDNSTSTVGSIGYLRTAGPTPGANDGMIFNNAETTKFRFIGASSTEFGATVNVTGYVTATTGMSVGGTAVSLDGHTHSYLPLSGGTLTGAVVTDVIRPATNNTKTVGTASYYYDAGYFDQIFVNEIVGTPTYSHTHSASEITSGTLDFARMATTWNGALTLDADTGLTSNYVRWTTQVSTLKAWDLIGRAHDYATSAQQNDLLLTYTDNVTSYIVWQADSGTRVVDFLNTPTVGGTAVSLSGHTHDDRYYTEAEVTSLLTGYVPTTRTVSAGSGLTGGGALSGNVTISHDDTSTQASVNNSGTTFIQDVTLDTYGHVTALGSVDISTALDALYVNVGGDTMTGTLTINAATQLTLQASGTDRATFAAGSGTLDISPLPDGSADTNVRLFRLTNTSGAKNLLLLAGDNTATTVHQLSVTGTTIFNAQLSNIDFNVRGDTDTNLVYVDASADAVGFGTSTPAYKVDVTGSARATVSVLTPTVTTTSGNLSLTSVGGTVAVTGALTGNSTAAFTTSVSTPTVTTASGNLTLTSTGGTVAVTGALTGSSTGVFTGTLTAASDTDAINTFGRVRLGYAAATDTASFAHFDQNTSTNFALSQSAAGATTINAVSGQTISLSNAGTAVATVGVSGIDMQSGKYIGSYDYASQSAGWRVDSLGGADFRYLYADQLHVKSFIADLEQALAGGQIISKSVAVLASDFVVPYAGGTQLLTVEDLPSASNMAVFEANDIVLMRQMSRAGGSLSVGYCWGTVTGYTDGAGTQTWTFTRSGTTTYNAVTMRGTAQSSTSSGATSRSVTKPTGVISGDVLIAVVTHDGSPDVITATGWTSLGYVSSTDINAEVFYKVAGGSEGASYTFSTVSSHAIGASVVAYYNVNTTSPIDDVTITDNVVGANMTAANTWATSTSGKLVFVGGVSNNTAVTPAAGMTEQIDTGSTGIRVYVADETLTTSGNQNRTATIASSSYASVAASVILRPTYSAMTAEAGTVTPGSTIEADGLVLDYGVSGNGVYEVNAIDGTYGANSPYAQVYTWTTHPATGSVVRTRMGNLTGISGATSGEYGLYAGSGTIGTTAQYLRISTAGVQLNNIPIKLYNAGTQTVNIDNAGTDIWVGPSSADKRLTWNGTTLGVSGSITISAGSGFAGSGYLQVGSGTKDSNLNGFNIDGTEIVGQASGVDQVVLGTDGKIKAGAGNVVLDSTGISVIGGSSFIIKQDAGTTKGYLYSSNPLDSLLVSNTGVGIKTAAAATTESVSLRANASGGRASEIAIEATASSGTNRVRMIAYSGNAGTSGQLTLGETSFALALNGTGSDDFYIDSTSAQFNVDVDMNGNDIIDIGSIGTVSTWTPGITFGGGSTGLTYSSRTGRYVKLGKLVYASCEIRLSAKGSSTGSAKITGLPATAATTAAGGVPSIIWYQMASNFVHVSGGVDTGGTAITLVGYTAAAASYAALTHADFANNSIIQMTVMYEAA